jgi:hypothetical protein
MTYVVISSVQFPGVYLRMDGTGVTESLNSGGGTVNCQYGASGWETFQIQWQAGGINIESVQFPGVYLRMDGTGVTESLNSGGGTVNCQYGASGWETFTLEWRPDGTVAIASLQFPGVYLRMDGTGVTASLNSGGGTVNCQYGVGASTTFTFTGVPGQLPELVSVPDLEGMNNQQAFQALRAAGLTLHYSTYMVRVCARPGIISRQAPSAGSEVLRGSTVNGMACMPFTAPFSP